MASSLTLYYKYKNDTYIDRKCVPDVLTKTTTGGGDMEVRKSMLI